MKTILSLIILAGVGFSPVISVACDHCGKSEKSCSHDKGDHAKCGCKSCGDKDGKKCDQADKKEEVKK